MTVATAGRCRPCAGRLSAPWAAEERAGPGGVHPDARASPRAGTRAVSRVVAARPSALDWARSARTAAAYGWDGAVRCGASLPEVGQVLRHRRLLSTAIYAKVDERALSELRDRGRPGKPS